MARLAYVERGGGSDPERVEALYAEIQALGRPVANLYRVLANQPAALEAFLCTSRYVRDQSSLEPRLRELAILATAKTLDQRYELAQHVDLARRAGVAEEQVTALLEGANERLAGLDRDVADYARDVALSQQVDDGLFARLQAGLGARTTVDLVLTVAWYLLCAAILGPLQVEVEPEYQGRV